MEELKKCVEGLKVIRNYVFKMEMNISISNSEYFQKVLNVAIDKLSSSSNGLDREKLKKEFYKKFTESHPGDSGIGGNDPQEPTCDWKCYPHEVLEWVLAICQEFKQTSGLERLDSFEINLIVNRLRKFWHFDNDQQHNHTWHDREDFIQWFENYLQKFGSPAVPSEEKQLDELNNNVKLSDIDPEDPNIWWEVRARYDKEIRKLILNKGA